MKKSIFLFFAAILCAMTANAAKERVYFVNTPGWTKVNVHAWGGTAAGTNWPGTTATKDTWQWNGKDVYYLEAEAGAYGQCIFNNGSGQQSADLTWTANSVYAHEAGKWTPVEIAKATTNGTKVYFVNTDKWTTVKVYAFSYSPKDTKNAAWPGANPTKESDKVGEYDVYSFTMNKEYDYCIFTNGASTNTKQTADLVVMDGADKYYCKDNWYTKEEAIAKLVAPIEYETVYFVNAADWTGTISAYAYTPVQNATWPGEPAAKEDYQIGGKNVYSYTAEKGKYKNVIFSGTGGQTADLDWTAGKYYVRDNWYTKEEAEAKLAAPVVDVYTVVGSEVLLGTDWDLNNADNEMTKQDDGSYILVKENVDLAKTGTYEYKVVKNHDWSWSVPSGTTNNTLKLGNEDVDGTYNVTFTLNKELNALTASLELVEAKKVIPECYVAGDESLTGQNWNAKSVLMTYDEATEVYTATLTAVPAGTHNMKVVYGGEWLGFDHLATPAPANVKEGDDKKIQFTLAEAGDVTVTYHATNGIGLTGNFAAPVTYDYYIAGTLAGGWSATQQGMAKEDDVYKHTFSELNLGTYEFKITDGQFNSEGDNTHEHTTLGAAYEEVSYNEGNIKIVTDEAINLTVIFDAVTDKITFVGLTPVTTTLTYKVKVPAGTDKCYIAGPCNNWEFREMTREGATDVFTIEIVGAKETDEYKYACKANWDYAEVREADENGNSNRKAWTALDEVTAWNKPVVYTYYLMGVNDDWATGIEMEVNTDAENEVMLTCQPVNGEVKIKRLDDDGNEYWYGGNSLKAEEGNLGTNTSTDGGDGNIKLPAGIYNFYFNTTDGKLWIAAATGCVLELGDGDNSSVLVNGVTVDLKVTRSFASGTLYTLALPFAMDNNTVKNIFGTDVELYDFTSLSENASGELILSFTKQATPAIAAGTPYLIKPKTNANGFDLTGVKINTETKPVEKECGPTTITMQPVLSATAEAKTNGASQYWLAADNNLHNNVVSIKGLRAIFDVQTTKANVRARAAFNENVETGVEDLFTTDTPVKAIVNGQLIIIRDGVKYNVQGQKL